MMAAMMLPGAVPAISRFLRVDGRLLADAGIEVDPPDR
jgi:predicted metal-binding membrane protein